MELITESTSPINVIEISGEEEKTVARYGNLFPNFVRALVIAKSGSGKTNLILNSIFNPNGLKFKNLYNFSKSIHQPKYKFLKTVLDGIEEIKCFFISDIDDVPEPEAILPHSLIIFDDVVGEKQTKMEKYFTTARHFLVDCILLAQSYTRCTKHLIREQANCLFLYSLDNLNMKYVFNENCCNDLSFAEFKDLCALCTWEKHSFLYINRELDKDNAKYRKMFNYRVMFK